MLMDTYTWRDDTQSFPPGALDRVLYTDIMMAVEHSFVLNTAIMSPEELRASGLEPGDVALDVSAGRFDHLPVVVDVLFPQQ